MATRAYCEHVAPELAVWSKRLHTLSEKIDRMPSIEKHHLLPQIEELHIIMTELDDRLMDMTSACSTIDTSLTSDDRFPSAYDAAHSNQKKGVSFDYDFGG
ncbi:MAG: hypothetical protein OEV73_07145 [Desulfobulbaceae bacterium]|nr:hypothetical protein [Desulfobulbaceae bacterium]